MPSNLVVRVVDSPARPDVSAALRAALADVERELELPGSFPADVQEAAERAAASPTLPSLDRGSLRLYNALPPGDRGLLDTGRW